MTPKNLFGIACKTCRRRGRKCDRTLPTCKNCRLRGAECEGYVLRWVNAAVERGGLADKTPGAPDHETNGPLTPGLRPLSKAKTTKARKVVSSAHSQGQTRSASSTQPHIPEHVRRSNRLVVQDITSRGFCVPQTQIWTIPITTMTAYDDLEDLVRYCIKTPDLRAMKCC